MLPFKLALQRALRLPDPSGSLTHRSPMKEMDARLLLLQGQMRPAVYFSAKLDPLVVGFPWCLRAVAAVGEAAMASREVVGFSDLMLLAPHDPD